MPNLEVLVETIAAADLRRQYALNISFMLFYVSCHEHVNFSHITNLTSAQPFKLCS